MAVVERVIVFFLAGGGVVVFAVRDWGAEWERRVGEGVDFGVEGEC